MTVSEIRSLMLEKVIPESLLPQNIAVCLMDENAAPPELDAFTFLNRLRSLGIGSADFLYLLKGCGAPEEAVSKIVADLTDTIGLTWTNQISNLCFTV